MNSKSKYLAIPAVYYALWQYNYIAVQTTNVQHSWPLLFKSSNYSTRCTVDNYDGWLILFPNDALSEPCDQALHTAGAQE